MAKKFVPIETEQQPVLIRKNSRVICLIEYEDRGNGVVVPITGYDVTAAYEHRRGRDALNGIPLLEEYVRPKSAGEVAYLTHAAEEGWNTSWNDLEEEQRESWRKIGGTLVKFLSGDDVPYLY